MKHTPMLTFLKRAIAIAMFAALVAVPATIAYQQSQPAAAKAEFPATSVQHCTAPAELRGFALITRSLCEIVECLFARNF